MLKFDRVPHPKGANKIGPKNSNVQYFSGTEFEKIDTLVRETIQNPLDNIFDPSKPVVIEFKEIMIPTSEIPCIKDIKDTIDALLVELENLKRTTGGQIEKYLEFYSKSKERLNNNHILSLKISDFNTIGLLGSRNDNNSNLGRFLGSTGYFDDGSSGGGSGGLGKFAPFGSSAVNFCFYSSKNTNGEYIYYGWGNNFYHKIDEKEYLGEINIGDNNDVLKLSNSYPNGFLSERTSHGTDVFIIGQQQNFESKWIDQVSKAVVRNFFGAIIDEKLIVKVVNINNETNLIDSSSISNYLHLFDSNQRISMYTSIPADKFILECIDSYQNGEVFNSLETEIKTPILGECEVRIIQNDEYSKIFSYIRGPKMLIFLKKLNYGDLPYTGVFCCKSDEGNKYLRNIEDSHHKAWNFESTGINKKINNEIKNFIKFCITEVASHESDDSFGLAGTNLFSFGTSRKSSSGSSSNGVTEEETSIIYPKNSFSSKSSTSFKFGGIVVVDKEGKRKKIEPKKPKYQKPNLEPKPQSNQEPRAKRRYSVGDFKAMIFKNDSIENEYHLFIKSDIMTDIRNISFSIPGAEGISFITSISDYKGNVVSRDVTYKESENVFENFEINKGQNKFVVKTKFNNKVEILIK
jgi:hypothetical protein